MLGESLEGDSSRHLGVTLISEVLEEGQTQFGSRLMFRQVQGITFFSGPPQWIFACLISPRKR